jgi:hypothetical protein
MDPKNQKEIDNRADQLNPNNEKYEQSRGESQASSLDDDDDEDRNNNVHEDDSDIDDGGADFMEEWTPQDAW